MGQSKSKQGNDALRQHSQEVEKFLAAEASKSRRHFKILILGAGESGKSTVLKQVKNVYKIPFNKVELDSIRQTIQFNCVQSMNILVKALVDYEIAVDAKTAKLVTSYTQSNTELTLQSATLIAKLWPRKPIQDAWAKRDEFWYLDAASYYFEHVERIGDPDFEVTEEDIVMARVRTTGISVTDFTQGGIDYSIVDVGGQRNERKKWIHCFSEHDSQLLTNRGFLFLDDVLQLVEWRVGADDGDVCVSDWRGLTVATYCENTGRLVYRTPNRLVVNAARSQRLVEFSSAPGDAAQISVVATDQHQLYARTSVENSRSSDSAFRKVTCGDLLRGQAIANKTRSLNDAERRAKLGAIDAVTFLTAAEAGVAACERSSSEWIASQFGVYGAVEQTAFLEAYGRSLVTATRVDEWAMSQLDKRAVRCVVTGWQSIQSGAMYASSELMRDDLVRLLMHGGFTTSFALACDESMTRAVWRVQYTEPNAVDATVRLGSDESPAREHRLRNARTWCFDMSSAAHKNDGFVVVRRVRRVTREQFVSLQRDAVLTAPQRTRSSSSVSEKRLSRAVALSSSDGTTAVGANVPDWVVVSSSRPTIQGNCFDDVKAVLFVVSLIGYNQVMYEDADQLRLREALTLFEQVVANPAFVDSTFILALNKKDIFEKMIREKPLSRAFPEFAKYEQQGLEGNDLLQTALQFIQKQFEDAYYSKSSTPAARRAITTHVIAARFKKDVKYMVEDIHSFIGEHRPGAPRMSAAAAAAAMSASSKTQLTSGRAASTRDPTPAAMADVPSSKVQSARRAQSPRSDSHHHHHSPRRETSPRSAATSAPPQEKNGLEKPRKKRSSKKRVDSTPAAPAAPAAPIAAETPAATEKAPLDSESDD